MFRRFSSAVALVLLFSSIQTSDAQISKGHQILINRGVQLQGLCQDDCYVTLSTYTNANYTGFHWINGVDGNGNTTHSSRPEWMGTAPGALPWGRWAANETNMPPQATPNDGSEAPYTNQLMAVCLADEWNLNDDTVRTRLVNWFNSVRSNYPNAILFHNNWGSQVQDTPLADFYTRAQPDMLCFDTYPWQSVYDTGQPNHTGPAIPGPPTGWYGDLRRYREHARGAGIPLGVYRQTFHAVQDYDGHVFRDPSSSELRLLTFAGLAFNAKFFVDFVYNTGANSFFTNIFNGAGDTQTNTSGLFGELKDINKRAINFGKHLVKLTAITNEANAGYTSSILFIRGRDSSSNLTTVPVGFLPDPVNGTYTTWTYQRNDPYLTNNWVVTNKAGVKNNGYPGDVIISWFRSLYENYTGPNYTNELYMMVVNGLTDPTGTAADCLQEIQLNFATNVLAVEMVNPTNGNLELQSLPLTNGFRRLTLNLNGGDGALFRFTAPGFSLQPSSQTIALSNNATLTARAIGAAPITYQWQFNGTPVSGATAMSYTRTNAQLADGGTYSVVASNSYGSVTSSIASLTVVSNTLFLYEPFDYSNIGSPVTSNTPANWSLNSGAQPNDCSVVSGSLSAPGLALPVGNSVTNGGDGLGARRLWGTNISSGVIYMSALFRINALGYGTWTPANMPAQVGSMQDSGNTARFQILVKSNTPSGYVIGLQKSGTGSSAVMDTTEYHAGDTVLLVGKYDFSVSPNTASLWINPSSSTFGAASDPGGSLFRNDGTNSTAMDRFNMRQNTAASVPAAMQWDEMRFGFAWSDVTPPGSSTLPQITSQPTNQTATAGSNPTFIVVATGTPSPDYQWCFNGANIFGATNNSFTRTNAQSGDAGSYTVLVTNIVGSVTSSVAILTVNTAPQITTQPQSRIVNSGSNVLFTVVATGNPSPTYQWRFNAGIISGATTSSFTMTNAQSTNEGSYSVVVSNIVGSITSSNAVLSVNVPPSINTQPTNRTVIVGSNTTFIVSAGGTAPLFYQWKFNNVNISSATNSIYNITSAQFTNAGTYSVIVSNVAASIASSNAVLTVQSPSPLHFDSITVLGNRQIRLRGSGNPGQLSIDATETLTNWNELTNMTTTDGTFDVIDPATNLFQRYYRARISP